jgi:tetratricopeptide (TPR) repeat protein
LPAESKRGAIIAGLLITVLLVGAFAYWGWAMTSKWQEVRRYPSVAHAQTVLTKNADDAVAYRTLGYDAQKRGDTQTALRQWNEAARLEPDNMHSAWAYANLLWQTGKTSEAEALFQKIAKSTNQVLAPEATKALAKIKAGQAPDPPPAPPAS